MMQKQHQPMRDVIDVFSADCPLCEDATETIRHAVQSCGCTVRERPWEEGSQQVCYSQGGAHPIPSIVAGGRVVFNGVPDPEDAQALIQSLRVNDGVQRGRPVALMYDGQPIQAYEGETIAAALLALHQRQLRRTIRRDDPRGVFCNMGVCFDCLMQIDGRPNVQACLTPVRDGMSVETQRGSGTWGSE